MSYEQAISILARVRAGDISPTLSQITEALCMTGDIDA
jgi:predicted transcriptional regulator